MRNAFAIAAALIGLTYLMDDAVAADPILTRTATATGLAKITSSEGDMPVFPYQGSLAIIPSRHGAPWPIMLRDATGRFNEVGSVLMPVKEDGHGCTAVDVTNPSFSGRDGLVDVICTKGACKGTCTRAYNKELWVQKAEGGFVNLAQSAGITQPHARGRDTTALTLPDGRVVVAFANERSPLYPAESIDRAYLVVDGIFTELPLQNANDSGLSNTAGSCVVAVPRPDALPDLLFCDDNMVNAYRHDGTAYHLTTAYGYFFARDMLVADVDHDGQWDILNISKTSIGVRVGGTVPVKLASAIDAHGLAYGDMNCDGAADILVVQTKNAGNAHFLLYNNGGGLSYRKASFPGPGASKGSGDTATYLPDWDGYGHPAMLVSNGYTMQGPTSFVTSSCTIAAGRRR